MRDKIGEDKEITFQVGKWSDEVADHLKKNITKGHKRYSVYDIYTDICNGVNELLSVYNGEDHIGWLLIRVEECHWHKELVIINGSAKVIGPKILKTVMDALAPVAKDFGCEIIRTHVIFDRPWLVRKFKSLGFTETETVLRKEI